MKSFFKGIDFNVLLFKGSAVGIFIFSMVFLIFTLKSFNIAAPLGFLMVCLAAVANFVIFKEIDQKTRRTIYQIIILITCCSIVFFSICLVGLIRAPGHQLS